MSIKNFRIFHKMKQNQPDKNDYNILRRHFDSNKIDELDFNQITAIQNKLLTIAFWDISKFSEVTKDLEANTNLLSDFLQEYFKIAIEVIHANDGCLDKFIGDGVMAIFGLQYGEEYAQTAAIRAVRAAIDFRVRYNILIEKWIEKNWQKRVRL